MPKGVFVRKPPTRWRKCDHPRTPENACPNGGGWVTCRTCKYVSAERYANTLHGMWAHERAKLKHAMQKKGNQL